MNRRFRTDRLICFVENDDIPGCLRLQDRKVILAAPFAADHGIAMPIVVTDQPHPGQWAAVRIYNPAHNITGRPGTAGAGLRELRPCRPYRMVAIAGLPGPAANLSGGGRRNLNWRRRLRFCGGWGGRHRGNCGRRGGRRRLSPGRRSRGARG